MLPARRPVVQGKELTLDEFLAILAERRNTLAAAAAHRSPLKPYPVPWRVGWRCYWKLAKRDADGSLKVIFRVIDRGSPGWSYVRRVRLVKAARLHYR